MKYIQKYYYILTGCIAFIFYILTIAPSVIQIDTGELAAVQCTLGIAHPTGYPLFTMLGYIFSLVPLPLYKIFQMNLLAALYCAVAVSVFAFTAKVVLDNLNTFQFVKHSKQSIKKRKKDSVKIVQPDNTHSIELSDTSKIVSAIFGGLFLALSKTFWFQSTSVEVYSLHLLLITLIILSLIKAFLLSDKEKTISKYWIIFAITLAFGFSNHMTTLLIIPGVAYLYFTKNGFPVKSIKQILFMLLIFFPILILIYSYLPIRASQNPVMNWGNPIEWERIIRHISGQQYQVWLFSSTEAAAKQFNYFVGNLINEFALSLVIAIVGIIVSFIYARKFFIFNIIVFLSTVLYSINYDINDIDSYFLLAYISLAFFAVFGIVQLILFTAKYKMQILMPISVLVLFTGIQFYSNYDDVNQRDNFVYEDYTKTILNTLPNNAIVFSYQWDYFISASYYFQLVENYRKDIVVIDKELLRRSWYYNQLNTNHPTLLTGVNSEVIQFKEALKPFEREEQFNANLLENLFRRIMTGLVATNIDKQDFFIAPELIDGEMKRGEFQLPEGYTLVPHLLLFKVVNTSDYVEAPLPDFKIKYGKKEDQYVTSLKGFVASMLVRRAMYELQFNKTDKAKIYAMKAAADFPNITLPPALSNLILN
jgi:tetratricopeptide (TPR) repeat protein